METSEKTPFARHAATLSWASVLFLFTIAALSKPIGIHPILVGLASLVFIGAGSICGIIALVGIRTHGTKGILIPAIIGLLLNAVVLSIFMVGFVKGFTEARARALQQRASMQAR